MSLFSNICQTKNSQLFSGRDMQKAYIYFGYDELIIKIPYIELRLTRE